MQPVPIQNSEIEQDNPMPSRNHSRVAQHLGAALDSVSDRYDIYQQLSLNLNSWPTVPDLALYPKGLLPVDWLSDEDEVTIPPALAIEILSPKQNIQPLIDKIRQYLEYGVTSCWLVEPATRVISVFPAAGGSRAFTEGELKDEALGILLPLSRIFR